MSVEKNGTYGSIYVLADGNTAYCSGISASMCGLNMRITRFKSDTITSYSLFLPRRQYSCIADMMCGPHL